VARGKLVNLADRLDVKLRQTSNAIVLWPRVTNPKGLTRRVCGGLRLRASQHVNQVCAIDVESSIVAL
jgi:hypothetical protein